MLSCLFIFIFAMAPRLTAKEYKGPGTLLASRDGATLFIAHYDAKEIVVLDIASGQSIRTIPLGKEPNGLVIGPDEGILYATSGGYSGVLQAVAWKEGKIVGQVPTGHTPTGGVVTPDGTKIFVCNRFNDDVTEFDLPDLKPVRRIKAVREPRGAVITPDGKKIFVLNALANDPTNFPEDENALIDVAAQVTVIDVASGETKQIRLPNGSGSCTNLCISSNGRYVYLTAILARFQMPTTQVERGWMNTNGISIIDTTKLEDKIGGFVNTVLLDDVDMGAANPYGITISADGKWLFVAVAGTDELIVVDAQAMHEKLDSLSKEENEGTYSGGISVSRSSSVPNDLAFLVGMKKRIRLQGKGARSVAVVGAQVYVGMYFSDTVQKIDWNAPGTPKRTEIVLGPKPTLTPARRGEMHWNDASLCMQRWQSCASCHPDARMDAYNWDLLNDGQGNPKNTKSLLWCYKTPPTMWSGVRKTSAHCTRTGFQFILFTKPDEEICSDIDEYLHSLDPMLSPYLVDGKLSEKARRGKTLFEDTNVGCTKCHPSPLFTDMKLHNVKTRCFFDWRDVFDTPTLVEIWRTAPYLHDGRYTDLKKLFSHGKHGDVQGNVESLTDEQIDDLVEYLLSL